MSDSWATVVAALIGALGAVLATRFEDIANLFLTPTRKLSGEWQGHVKTLETGNDGHPPFEMEYNLAVKQTGQKVRAVMTETKITEGYKPYTYVWEGVIRNEYFVFQGYSKNPEQFIALSGNLYISPTGHKLHGYMAGNAGSRSPVRVWAGYAELQRKV